MQHLFKVWPDFTSSIKAAPHVLLLADYDGTLAAIVGKQVCGLGVLERGLDRLSVGVGMIPRGEVGLIFAGIGKSLGVMDDATFSAVVIMVIATTLITPPLLKVTLARQRRIPGAH